MKHLKKDHKSHCLLYSFAMVTDIDPDVFIKELGVTGTEKVFSGSEPLCCRSFHIVELVVVAYKYGVYMLHIPQLLGLTNQDGTENIIFQSPEIDITGKRAVICTRVHAYAWDGSRLINPDTGKETEMIKASEIESVVLRAT